MEDWDDVVAFACALPDVRMERYYGTPCPKLNGKPIASPSREADSFHLPVGHAEKAMLMETDPDTFWQTPHYEAGLGYWCAMVRPGTGLRCICGAGGGTWRSRRSGRRRGWWNGLSGG